MATDWRDSRILRLEQLLAQAVEYLHELGSSDPYTGQPYDEVVEFLASDSLRQALRGSRAA